MQRNFSINKNSHHEAREQLNSAQQKVASAEKQLEEIQSRAHAESRKAASRIKALEVQIFKSCVLDEQLLCFLSF